MIQIAGEKTHIKISKTRNRINVDKVAVVILNWNGLAFLQKFLPNVIKYSKNIAQVVVADNDSKDGSIDYLKENFPEVRLIVNNENGGFSKGYNQAFSQIEAEYYVLLNSDIEVTENWLQPVIALMDSDENIAACQPKIRYYNDKKMFEYSGAAGGFIDKYGYPFCKGRIFDTIEEDTGQYNKNEEIFWASGACLFVKAKLYHQLGGLDEDFFAHMEEIDFCWRLKNQGYKIFYCADSIVYHIGGGTLPKANPRKTYLNFRNNLALLYKNLPDNRVFLVFFIRLFLDKLAFIQFLTKGKTKDAMAIIKAYRHFWKMKKSLKSKRTLIQPKPVSNVYRRSIVWKYYIEKRKHFSSLKSHHFTS